MFSGNAYGITAGWGGDAATLEAEYRSGGSPSDDTGQNQMPGGIRVVADSSR